MTGSWVRWGSERLMDRFSVAKSRLPAFVAVQGLVGILMKEEDVRLKKVDSNSLTSYN